MIRKILIFLAIIFIVLATTYISKLLFFKPFSFNHFLTRQLVYDALESPEYLTYIGILEKYGYRSYNGKLSDYSLKKDIIDLKKLKKEFKILNSYEDKDLSAEELTSKKISLLTQARQFFAQIAVQSFLFLQAFLQTADLLNRFL